MIYIAGYQAKTGIGYEHEIKLDSRTIQVHSSVKCFFELLNRDRPLNSRTLKRYAKQLETEEGTDDLYVLLLCKVARSSAPIFKQNLHPYRKAHGEYTRERGFRLTCDKEEFERFACAYLDLPCQQPNFQILKTLVGTYA